ncbi:DoxX family membrane protein [Propioniciclava sp. MC1683]|uniref:DoxX family membrane protein n=1 Tax=Propioniciclava sp. MC1683 TaxID=2760309 RepID=UPI0015FF14CC|nr:DoxX family membrane protein [Propioniciclava sp. MC1683]MBB1501159.1 DoxX family membrane protein [Propioniciclava sp. MC1683]
MADPHTPVDDPDAERTQVLDTQAVRDQWAPPPTPVQAPPYAYTPAPAYAPAPQPDLARVDHRGSLAWDLEVARRNNRPSTDVGLLLLRLFSLPLVLRGVHHVATYPQLVDSLRGHALLGQAPEVIGTLVVAGELVLPVLLAVGLATRLAGAAQAVVGATLLVAGIGAGPLLDPATGALAGEVPLLYAALGLALLFTGPGRISLDRALTSAGQERRVEKRVARRLGE